ncbi:UNVERIFIED_CONTAM: hypothetical protein K2H54_010768 [Gekko kuhli]
MSQLSSTLKRYVGSSHYRDSSYGKSPSSYGAYSSYTSNLSSSYPDKEKIGYKPGTTSSYLTSSHLRTSGATTSPSSSLNYDGGGRLLQRPDSGTRLSPSYGRVPLRPPGSSGLSGGASYSFSTTASTSFGTMLGRKKSSSHSDLARDLSGMHLSDSYRVDSTTRNPSIARNRQELCTLQGFYQQPARHSDYVKDYLETCSRKVGRSPVSLHGSDVITPTLRPVSNCSLQQWERTESRTDIMARESSTTTVTDVVGQTAERKNSLSVPRTFAK